MENPSTTGNPDTVNRGHRARAGHVADRIHALLQESWTDDQVPALQVLRDACAGVLDLARATAIDADRSEASRRRHVRLRSAAGSRLSTVAAGLSAGIDADTATLVGTPVTDADAVRHALCQELHAAGLAVRDSGVLDYDDGPGLWVAIARTDSLCPLGPDGQADLLVLFDNDSWHMGAALATGARPVTKFLGAGELGLDRVVDAVLAVTAGDKIIPAG